MVNATLEMFGQPATYIRMRSMIKRFSYGLHCLLLGSLLLAAMAQSVVAGPIAPKFTAVSLDGKSVGSASLAGKAYIVNFFASWCPPCRAEVPDMVLLQSKYASKGFTFIGMAVSDGEPAIREFAKNNRINYPVVMASDQLVSSFSKYADGGINGIPTSSVVNSTGRIIQVIVGARRNDVYEKLILEALRKPGTTK